MPISFFGSVLAAGGELGGGGAGGRFRHLAAGVGVDLGVEQQDVDILAGGEDVVESAVADVIGPAVAADNPYRFLDQIIGDVIQLDGDRAGLAFEFGLELGTRRRCSSIAVWVD